MIPMDPDMGLILASKGHRSKSNSSKMGECLYVPIAALNFIDFH